jgi:methanethiol S-methyltransferase
METKGKTMSRILFPVYGALCYLTFFATFIYMIGFVHDFHFQIGSYYFVPVAIDFGGNTTSTATAFIINVALIGLFGLQHSGMARRGFKAVWTRILVPHAVERSTYVLASSLCLIVLFIFWQPMPSVVWSTQNEMLGKVLVAVSLLGFAMLLVASFLINHFELFGLQQVYMHAKHGKGAHPSPMAFKSPGLYKLVRHPIYVGFLIFAWVTPVMTAGHLLFATGSLIYILIGMRLEEHDLVKQFGDTYKQYQRRVRGLVPLPKGKE